MPEVGRRGGGVLRIGRQRAGDQRDPVVEPHREAVHRADEGVAPAADHADPQPVACGSRRRLHRPSVILPFRLTATLAAAAPPSKAAFHFSGCGTAAPRYRAAKTALGGTRVARHRVLGISFDHMHMGDLLRQVAEHPDAEIAGIFDPDRSRMAAAIANFAIPEDRVFTDLEACLAETGADLAIVCSATAEHADTVEAIAPHGLNVMVEKPFAASAADARRMIAAMDGNRRTAGDQLAARLVSLAQHRQAADRRRRDRRAHRGAFLRRQPRPALPSRRQGRGLARGGRGGRSRLPGGTSKASGGGSLLDYLGYGTTLGTWFMNGEAPLEVTSVVDETPGIEVDQHSITVCRYARGLSKFETRWGTLTDPWTMQPQPKCGFVLVGTDGSISSYDYDAFVTLQTREAPAPVAGAGRRAAARPARAGRIHARPHRRRRADHRPARPRARADRPADDRQRRAFRARASARCRWCHDRDRPRRLRAEGRRRRRDRGARARPTGRRCRRAWRPRIALVGAGGIAAAHLAAYRAAGFDVAVICNRTLARAEARRDEFFPAAEATDDIARTLARDDIAVVDLTPHPAERLPLIETALAAGKHVLSQKPFVLDLDAGARLCDLADAQGVVLAVNQNGRWAPHLAWMREAVRAGLIGAVQSCDISDPLGPRLDRRHAVRGDRRPDPLRLRRALVRFPREPRRPRRPRSSRRAPAPPARRSARRCSPRPGRLRRRRRRRSPSTAPPASAPRTAPSSPAARAALASRGPDLGDQAVTLATADGHRPAAARGHLVPGRLRRHHGRAPRARSRTAASRSTPPAAISTRWRWSSPRSPRPAAACRSSPAAVRSLAEAQRR